MLHVSFPCFLFLRIVFYFLTPKNSFLISWFSLNFPWLGNDILFTTQYFSYMRHTENIENSIFLILKKVINFVLGRRVTCHRIITSVGWGPWPTCPKIALSLYLVKYAFSPISLLLFIYIYIYIYIILIYVIHGIIIIFYYQIKIPIFYLTIKKYLPIELIETYLVQLSL